MKITHAKRVIDESNVVAVTVNVQYVNICQRAAHRFTYKYKQQLIVYFAREITGFLLHTQARTQMTLSN